MQMQNKSLYIFLLIATSFLFLKALAFVIPDLEVIGKTPEITGIESKYLIPGQKIKIHGKNFFEIPKSANKIWINNCPVRVLKSEKDFLEVIIPKIPFGKARLRLYTNYMGYKSKEAVYPKDDSESINITFGGPVLHNENISSVLPGKSVLIHGNFRKNNLLIFKINSIEIKPESVSDSAAELSLPSTLPPGPFKIISFYRKYLKNNEYIDSAISNKLILFNLEKGLPDWIKIALPDDKFDSVDREYPYRINLGFNNFANTVDVTGFSKIELTSDDVFDLNIEKNIVKVKGSGSVKLKASFKWMPENLTFTDEVTLVSELPRRPNFAEVIINEVFPFPSSTIPATDANMDGFAKSDEDEFIELKNVTKENLDLSACKLFTGENKTARYEFPDNTVIEPTAYAVVFGNQAEGENLNLINTGTTIEFVCDEMTIDYAGYSGGKSGDPSWQRKNDLSGFEKHPIGLFSPWGPPDLNQGVMIQNIFEPIPVLITNSVDEPEPFALNEISVLPVELLFQDQTPQQISVTALYANGEEKEITSEAGYKITGAENVINVDSNGLVTPLSNGTVTIEINYQDKTIELIANVNLLSKVQPKQLIINEVLAAPTVDVNKDGIFKSDQDEFIEIVNISGQALDIGGLLVSDNTKVRHTVPLDTVLQNLEPIIIFGGGSTSTFSDSIMSQVANTGSLGLNNTGPEQVTISTNDNRIIDQASFDNNNIQGISLNRTGDLSFNLFNQHDKFLKAIGKYSPGTRIDGTLFASAPQPNSDLLKGSSSSSSSSGVLGSSSSSSSSGSSSSSSSGSSFKSSSSSGGSSSSGSFSSSSSSSGNGA